ncbi:hypothetical protein TRIP_B50170 [uncultured Desulfatiglans sp.]|nr:hypothetical protein TRIP_B50170 [uncultured Desulfatiglans sp.]
MKGRMLPFGKYHLCKASTFPEKSLSKGRFIQSGNASARRE